MDDTPHGSLRKVKNDVGPQVGRLIDDILAGRRTVRDLATTERLGRRVREVRPNLEAIQREAKKLEKEPGAADRITEKPE